MAKTWNAEQINEFMRTYQGLCVLGAAAELELFSRLGTGSATAAELARTLPADERALAMLLDVLAALDFLVKTGNRYACAPGVAAALSPGQGSVLAMSQHQMNCLRRWSNLALVVKTGQPSENHASIRGEAGDQQSFIEAMNDISGPVAETVVRDIANVPWTHIIDIGGGSGTYTLAWLAKNKTGRATLFDLPHVIPMARARLEKVGELARVSLVAGDFTKDELPRGADLAWVSAIIHQQSREMNRALYARIARALVPGGRIMIRDIIMEDSRTAPIGGALFAINMLAVTASGGTFTLAEIRADLESAGFADVKQIRPDAWMSAVVSARLK